MKSISDRPGRYLALFVLAPLLYAISERIRCTHPKDAELLKLVSVSLFLYESFWVSRTHAELVS